MPRQLKIWNGGGWGRQRYNKNNEKIPTSLEDWCESIYVCAHSKAEAVRLINEVHRHTLTTRDLDNYFSPCWGNAMDGIEPELGVWGQQHFNSEVVRLYPKEK